MASVNGFRVAGALAAAVLAVAPLLPPAHVHEAEEHGHVRWTVHQHLSRHALVPDAGLPGHVEDHDAPILTRTTVFTLPAHHHGVTAPLADVVAFLEPLPVRIVHRSAAFVEPLIHGPPRAPAPARPPPFSPAI